MKYSCEIRRYSFETFSAQKICFQESTGFTEKRYQALSTVYGETIEKFQVQRRWKLSLNIFLADFVLLNILLYEEFGKT